MTTVKTQSISGNTKQSTRKLIESITITRMVDESPDTSWLGEYANSPNSEYSIDRAHSLECPINTGETPLDTKQRNTSHVDGNTCECADSGCKVHQGHNTCNNPANTILYRVDMTDESGTLMCSDCADDATISGLFTESDDDALDEPQCDCGERRDMERNQYRYFNPSFNYVDKSGTALPGNTPDDVRKNMRQDYERMESLNAGQWCFIGIAVEASISVPVGQSRIASTVNASLWGIESDSGDAYFKETEDELLGEVCSQLTALGFSKRAIAAAMKNVEHVNE